MTAMLVKGGLGLDIPSKEKYDKFLKTVTIVVMDEAKIKPESQELFKKYLRDEWELTKLKFLSQDEFNENFKDYSKNDKYSFFALMRFGTQETIYLTSNITRKFYSTPKEQLTMIACDFYNNEKRDDYPFKPEVEYLKNIRAIKGVMNMSKEGKKWDFKKAPAILSSIVINIAEGFVTKEDKGGFDTKYPYTYKVVPTSEVVDAIKNKTKGYVYYDVVYSTSDGTAYLNLMNAETGEPIYVVYMMSAKLGLNNYFIRPKYAMNALKQKVKK